MARLDDEDAVVGQVLGHVVEAADLVVLGEQVEEGVEHDVDQPVATGDGDRGEVTDGDIELVAAGLGPEAVDHRRRQVDAVDPYAGGGQGQADPPGANGQFEDRSVPGEVGEERDRLRLVAADLFLVVDGRGVLTEAHDRLVVLHARQSSPPGE